MDVTRAVVVWQYQTFHEFLYMLAYCLDPDTDEMTARRIGEVTELCKRKAQDSEHLLEILAYLGQGGC